MPHIERGQWNQHPCCDHHGRSAAAATAFSLKRFGFQHGVLPLLSPGQWERANQKVGAGWFSSRKKQGRYGGKGVCTQAAAFGVLLLRPFVTGNLLFCNVDYLADAYATLLEYTGSLASPDQTCPEAFAEHLPPDHSPATVHGRKICRAYNVLLTQK